LLPAQRWAVPIYTAAGLITLQEMQQKSPMTLSKESRGTNGNLKT